MGQYRARDLLLVPSLLSMLRLPLAVAFALVVRAPAIAFAVLAFAGCTDVLDGWYARTRRQTTATGAVADAVTDKVFVLTVVISLVVAHKMNLLEALLLGTRDAGELPLAARLALRHEARHSTQERRANFAGKLATLLQFVAVTAVLFGVPHVPIYIGAAAAAGVLAAVSYWMRERQDRARAGQYTYL